MAEALGGDAKGDGKIKLGDIRAMYVQKLLTRLGDKITTTDLARAINTSTRTIYADMDREIPVELSRIKHSHKRLNVDLAAGLEC